MAKACRVALAGLCRIRQGSARVDAVANRTAAAHAGRAHALHALGAWCTWCPLHAFRALSAHAIGTLGTRPFRTHAGRALRSRAIRQHPLRTIRAHAIGPVARTLAALPAIGSIRTVSAVRTIRAVRTCTVADHRTIRTRAGSHAIRTVRSHHGTAANRTATIAIETVVAVIPVVAITRCLMAVQAAAPVPVAVLPEIAARRMAPVAGSPAVVGVVSENGKNRTLRPVWLAG